MTEINQSNISIEKLQSFISSKADLYEATVRNGFFLPKINSSIVTEDYIMNVI